MMITRTRNKILFTGLILVLFLSIEKFSAYPPIQTLPLLSLFTDDSMKKCSLFFSDAHTMR